MTKETRIARDGLALEERRGMTTRCTCGHRFGRHQATGAECAMQHCKCGTFKAATTVEIARIHLAEVETDVCYDSEKREMAEAVIAMEAKLAKYTVLEAEARGLLAKARVCVDRPWMGCAIDHDTIENWIGDAVDALDPKQGAE